MSALIWLHEDALRMDHPVFKVAGKGAEAVFIWDDGYFQSEGYSLKRLVFIYELFCDLDVTCIKGDTAEILTSYGEGRKIFAPKTPNPKFQNIMANLSDVTIVPDIPLVVIADDVDLKRFFRFWNKAKTSALSPSIDSLI